MFIQSDFVGSVATALSLTKTKKEINSRITEA